MEKTILIAVNCKQYVGNPVYENDVVVEVKDCWQMDSMAIPMPQADGSLDVTSVIVGIKIGKLIEISDDVVIAELSNTSPYYLEYVRCTSGIELATSNVKSHIRSH